MPSCASRSILLDLFGNFGVDARSIPKGEVPPVVREEKMAQEIVTKSRF